MDSQFLFLHQDKNTEQNINPTSPPQPSQARKKHVSFNRRSNHIITIIIIIVKPKMIQVFLILIVLVLLFESGTAFRGMPIRSFRDNSAVSFTNDKKQSKSKSKSKSNSNSSIGWSLQMPEVPLPKSTWYNEVSNPTARRITYDDGPYEFQFSAVGSSWPDTIMAASSGQGQGLVGTGGEDGGTSSSGGVVSSSGQRHQRVGPLRRVGKFIRRRF